MRIKMSDLKEGVSQETGRCRDLALELAKKYSAGSSIPGREIDLVIADWNADRPYPLDMRSAWEEISGILQNMGRKIGTNIHILDYSKNFHADEIAKRLKRKFPGKQLTNQQLMDIIKLYLVGKEGATSQFIHSLESLIISNLKSNGWKIN